MPPWGRPGHLLQVGVNHTPSYAGTCWACTRRTTRCTTVHSWEAERPSRPTKSTRYSWARVNLWGDFSYFTTWKYVLHLLTMARIWFQLRTSAVTDLLTPQPVGGLLEEVSFWEKGTKGLKEFRNCGQRWWEERMVYVGQWLSDFGEHQNHLFMQIAGGFGGVEYLHIWGAGVENYLLRWL